MSLAPPPKVQKLQTTLHAKAKGAPGYRFYALYDKVYRRDILEFAYLRCRSNDGAPGVDRQAFADIEAYGRDRWLDELTTDLRNRTYRPDPVRRVFIPKGDGKRRPLGIGTIRDRVVRWPWCWSWSQSSRPTFSRNNTPTGQTTTPWTPSGKFTGT